MVHAKYVHGRACLPIPHSTYHRRPPTVPQSHRSQTAILWPLPSPPSLIRVNSTTAKAAPAPAPAPPSPPFPQNRACKPLPLPHRCGDHRHTPSHRTFVPYSSPTLLRPSSTLYRAPSQSIVTMRGSTWIKSARGPITALTPARVPNL